jgi:hypothetical protein
LTQHLLILGLAMLALSATSVRAATDGSLSDANIKYFGRWDFSSPSQFVSYWGGAYIKVNFSGTTVKINLGNTCDFFVKIDGGAWISYPADGGVFFRLVYP